MPQVAFDALPDDARLWVFAAAESLDDAARADLLGRVDAFLEGWNAHGHPLTAGRRWLEDRFLLVAVDEATAPPSGCSIDALHRILKSFEDERGVGLTDHAHVVYRDTAGTVARASRPDFARMARDGVVDLDTVVFDTTVTRKSAVDDGFEGPAGATWHRRAFWRNG